MEVLDSGYLERGLYRNRHGRQLRVVGVWWGAGTVTSIHERRAVRQAVGAAIAAVQAGASEVEAARDAGINRFTLRTAFRKDRKPESYAERVNRVAVETLMRLKSVGGSAEELLVGEGVDSVMVGDVLAVLESGAGRLRG